MTDFFAYDALTWPDVAALRRDTPLVIPLGQGYNGGGAGRSGARWAAAGRALRLAG